MPVIKAQWVMSSCPSHLVKEQGVGLYSDPTPIYLFLFVCKFYHPLQNITWGNRLFYSYNKKNHAIYFYLMTDDSCILFYRVWYCISYRTENKLFYFYFYFKSTHKVVPGAFNWLNFQKTSIGSYLGSIIEENKIKIFELPQNFFFILRSPRTTRKNCTSSNNEPIKKFFL